LFSEYKEGGVGIGLLPFLFYEIFGAAIWGFNFCKDNRVNGTPEKGEKK